ncbi:MAG: hypothetical protein JO179_11920 [Solirubrobacterales bacterium]|nr:hypothetical protein [Solirubrobacterales bacterium]
MLTRSRQPRVFFAHQEVGEIGIALRLGCLFLGKALATQAANPLQARLARGPCRRPGSPTTPFASSARRPALPFSALLVAAP